MVSEINRTCDKLTSVDRRTESRDMHIKVEKMDARCLALDITLNIYGIYMYQSDMHGAL